MKKIDSLRAFVAYPSQPIEIGQSIRAACSLLEINRPSWKVKPWEANEIAGYCLTDPILENIQFADILIADITRLNFNVTYEIGYAIGLRKRVFLVKNKTINDDRKLVLDVGIFDTLGFVEYENSEVLAEIIKGIDQLESIPLGDSPLDKQAPVYIVTPREKGEAEIRIISRIKKAGGVYFRSFDPIENPRLSVRSALESVYPSIGIVLPLLPSPRSDAAAHNIRCAFVAGISHALQKTTLIIQAGSSDPVPLDLRDFVTTFDTVDSINRIIAEFVPLITKRLQEQDELQLIEATSPLAGLYLGQSAAENEMNQLAGYYLQTEEFSRVLNGEAHVVAGRKGSGKSALFFQVRNKLRSDKRRVVLDLNPEGFQLQKLKNFVLRYLEQGTREHTIIAFWEYLFYLEICYKLLEKGKNTYLHNHLLRDKYLKLAEMYNNESFVSQGDFAERLLKLTDWIEEAFESNYSRNRDEFLTRGQITEILHRHDLPALRDAIVDYLQEENNVWILFDNIDKGWHAHGIDQEDLLILRCLLDALSKLRREFRKEDIEFRSVVFLRNDVYELLVESMPDRGKISKVTLDWTDSDLLKEVLRRRFVTTVKDKEASFDVIWRNVAQTHVIDGRDSAAYVLERCLMRPRALIDFLSHAKAHGVNLRHSIITEEDFLKGEESYSTDLINLIDLEITDVYPDVHNSLYAFIEATKLLDSEQVNLCISALGLDEDKNESILDLFLWYGFLGILREDGAETYIYNVSYEMRKLKALRNKRPQNDLVYCINPAFWKGLDIKD